MRPETSTNQLELAELSRLIKKFTKELEGRMLRQSQEEVTLKLLGVLDFFDNLLKSIPENSSDDVKSIKESVEIIQGKLMRILGDYGLEAINCMNEKFNPEYHECIDMQSILGKEPNIIIKEVLRGYKLGEAIIRYPKVIVSA